MQVTLNVLLTHQQRLPLIYWENSTLLAREQGNSSLQAATIRKLTALTRPTKKTLIILNPFWALKREERTGNFSQGHWEQMKADQNSSRSREENRVRGQNRREREDSRAVNLHQPGSFQINCQAVSTTSQKYTPQNNQQPLNNCTGPDEHYDIAYNGNLYNGFPCFRSPPPDRMQNQALMFEDNKQ